jgi:hypothetical protein
MWKSTQLKKLRTSAFKIVRLVGFTREKHLITFTKMKTMIDAKLLPIGRIARKTETVSGSMILREEEASVNIIPGRNWKVTPVRCSEGYGAPHPTLRR